MGSLNENVLFSGGVGRGRPRSKNKNTRVNIRMTYVRPHINKQISPICNCVTPESVSFASLSHQLLHTVQYNTYTQGEYGQISLVLIESNWLQIRISNYVASKEVFFATK